MPKLPPFHSRTTSRTRPGRRRPNPLTLTARELMRQKSLSKTFIVIAAIVALISLTTAALSRMDSDNDAQGAATGSASVPVAPTASATTTITVVPGSVLVDVTNIVDGDTIDVRAAQTDLRVRFYGVDTPERGDRCFKEATERTRILAGSQVQLLADARQRDRSSRELRYVYTTRGESIDAALIREGLALAWREDGAQRIALIALEEQAKASKTGCLWSGS